jgi:transcriptional regulator with XRE-family HTH domain
MESLGERIEKLVQIFAKGNKSAFSRVIGINEANLRNYISGTAPKPEIIERISESFGINVEWLLKGEGEMRVQTGFKPVNSPKDANYYERIIEAKDELIKYLKKRVEELESEKSGDLNKSVV